MARTKTRKPCPVCWNRDATIDCGHGHASADPDPAERKCGCPESLRLRAALGRVVQTTYTGSRAHAIAREALE